MSSFTAHAFPFVLFPAFFALNNKSGKLSLVKPLDFDAAVQYGERDKRKGAQFTYRL